MPTIGRFGSLNTNKKLPFTKERNYEKEFKREKTEVSEYFIAFVVPQIRKAVPVIEPRIDR